MVPANSRRIPRAPRYSGYHYQIIPYLYGSFTLYGLPFQARSSSDFHQIAWSYNPRRRRNDSGLGYSAFARHYLRNHILFSLPTGTKMFQFPALALYTQCLVFNQTGYPIRISPDQRSFAPPRSFSQLTTSFIASLSPGIHHSLFSFFFFRVRQQIAQNDARASLKRLVSPLSPPQQVVSGTPIKGLRKL